MYAIGIGGISRSGKSSLARKMSYYFQATTLSIDDYSIGPVLRVDREGGTWEDWEDPAGYDLSQFKRDLEDRKKNGQKLVIAEGFLLYHSQEIVSLLDLKLFVHISKELCRTRRRDTKNFYPGRFELEFEHVWGSFNENNQLFNVSDVNCHILNGEDTLEAVFSAASQILLAWLPSSVASVYQVSMEREVEIKKLKLQLQVRDNTVEELYRKLGQLVTAPTSTDDSSQLRAHLDETNKKLLKCEDLLSKQQALLSASKGALMRITGKAESVPVKSAHRRRASSAVTSERKNTKVVFLEVEDSDEQRFVEHLCTQFLPQFPSSRLTFCLLDERTAKRIQSNHLTLGGKIRSSPKRAVTSPYRSPSPVLPRAESKLKSPSLRRVTRSGELEDGNRKK